MENKIKLFEYMILIIVNSNESTKKNYLELVGEFRKFA